MAKWIYCKSLTDKPVFVNMDHIVSVSPIARGSTLTDISGQSIKVEESPDEVMTLMRNA